MPLQTRLTKLLNIRVPLVSAPMTGVAGGLLAASVCRAGGLGLLVSPLLHVKGSCADEIAGPL